MKPILGTFTDPPGPARIDLPRLLETRMLIQANSGGGKSWLIRRLLEQTAGQVQQLVIDPEGEFPTLRERFDYVIAAARDADAIAHPRTAALLARRLLETGVSAILDIYDLKAHERQAFVRLFCEALVNAPKALWRPTLVVLDEAHVFCPEAGKSESAGAVIDLATRGRKRGFALIAATQRLAKLHKDTAAELLNKLVGRTGLDVDVRRAADELGMTPREAMEKLRALEAGDFYAFGPALSPVVRQLRVGDVQTSHPKAGKRTLQAPPKPTAAIMAVLPKLADLPKEAEQEQKTLEDLRRDLANTKRELTIARKASPAPTGPSKEDITAAEARGQARGIAIAARALKAVLAPARQDLTRAIREESEKLRGDVEGTLDGLLAAVANIQIAAPPENPERRVSAVRPTGRVSGTEPGNARAARLHRQIDGGAASNGALTGAERKILTVLSQHPEGCEIGKIALLAGYAQNGGGFRNSLSSLRAKGAITGENTGTMRITDEGMDLGPFPDLPTGSALREHWLTSPAFGAAARKSLRVLLEHPDGLGINEIAMLAGYEVDGGGFRNGLAELRTAGVLVGRNTETMTASEDLLA